MSTFRAIYYLFWFLFILFVVFLLCGCNGCSSGIANRLVVDRLDAPLLSPLMESLQMFEERGIILPLRTNRFIVAPIIQNPTWAGVCEEYEIKYEEKGKKHTTFYYQITIVPKATEYKNVLLSIMLHELGHCELGLKDDYENENSFMFWTAPSIYITKEEVALTLDEGLRLNNLGGK